MCVDAKGEGWVRMAELSGGPLDALPGCECKASERVSGVVKPEWAHALRLDLAPESIPCAVYVPFVE